MLAHLKKALTPQSYPSALIVIGTFGGSMDMLHLVPESGGVERFGYMASYYTFRRIGTATLQKGDGDSEWKFLDNVESKVGKLWSNFQSSTSLAPVQTGAAQVDQIVEDVLKPAALAVIRERGERPRSTNGTKDVPVYIVRIKRPKAREILTDPTTGEMLYEPTSFAM
ncbi:hypothetical protein AJ79_06727 [Helicocarpus griseus UAMH5409]|uniref:Uncharacterized protein n=1 Tax=Helicocarpus griseus UAMH5409 TaxID=1447875 RepID=A0A2B7XAB8_9EURO|nr:hypothetical protein AJ79_06727 [Helicocarpus griseus UAMH5409]